MKKLKVKEIKFTAKFNSTGCVNYDSIEQKKILKMMKSTFGQCDWQSDNFLFSKKRFRYNSEGEMEYIHKISSACLRYEMFKSDMRYCISSTIGYEFLMPVYLSEPCLLERGYMIPSSNNNSLLRKSPLCITDALENTNCWHAVPFMEVHNRYGDKDKNSFFFIEDVPQLDYVSEGMINLQELQFIPLDTRYGRLSFPISNKALFDEYVKNLEKNFNNSINPMPYIEIKKIQNKNVITGEYGILLDNDSVDFMVKDILKRILNVSRYNRHAMMKCTGLEISTEVDGKEEFFKITKENIDDFYFETIPNYAVQSEEKKEKIIEDMEKDKKSKKSKKSENE